ncbi:MAG: Gfo/Idh/MocA family oxidoreductase [Elusimicrobia bacterium]|nr:Gfo/Idh/MocA family oxidoreductase [Elusimicrobiota bacterium]
MPEEPRGATVAVIGAGYTAKEHLRAFRDCAGVTLAGIFSRTRDRAQALASEFAIPLVCDSVDELFERTQADLVVVTVNELSMLPVATECFRFPWTALLEKPPGIDLAAARKLQAAASASARRVFVALNRRTMSSTLAVRVALQSEPGPRFIKVQDQEDPARALAAGQPPEVVANWMFANSIHVIDYFAQFARGRVLEVRNVIPWEAADPKVVVSKITFDSGDIGLYEGIWRGPGPWAVSVTTPGRRWELRPLEQAVAQGLGHKPEPLPSHPWDAQFKPGYRLQAELAAAAALGKEPAGAGGTLATLETAVGTMELIHAIFRP